MRIAIGQLWQETNTLNPIPTTRCDFKDFGVLRGPALVNALVNTNELGGFIQSLRRRPEQPEIVGLLRLPGAMKRVAFFSAAKVGKVRRAIFIRRSHQRSAARQGSPRRSR